MTTFSKSYVSELARRKDLVVTFTKNNGENRVMNCTLRPEVLPENTSKTKRPENPDVLSVWDLDKNAWRSFRLDSISSVQYESGV